MQRVGSDTIFLFTWDVLHLSLDIHTPNNDSTLLVRAGATLHGSLYYEYRTGNDGICIHGMP